MLFSFRKFKFDLNQRIGFYVGKMKNLIFDIKEFSINDGPGVRITVFLKGCPLRCKWCHNPEGLEYVREKNLLTNSFFGEEWGEEALVDYLCKFKELFLISNGGVTFSGGEPLSHLKFLLSVSSSLKERGIHTCVQTSGFVSPSLFKEKIINAFDLFLYDLKIINQEKHIGFTGKSNSRILLNLQNLAASAKQYIIRVPLIPGITDTTENFEDMVCFLKNLETKPISVEFLSYNEFAPGKYPAVGKVFPLNIVEKKVNVENVINTCETLASLNINAKFRK